MKEHRSAPPAEELVRALCEEARSLAAGLRGSLSRIVIRAGDHRVEVEWQDQLARQAEATAGPAEPAARPVEAPAEGGAVEGRELVAVTEPRHAIVAPLVGTFYRAPEPNANPFVEEGDVVDAGQDVAIIEAMKLMNRVQADRAGKIVKILVPNGEMVEFGQELMILEPLEAGP